MRLVPTALAVLVASTLVALAPAAAEAETWSHDDRAGDVYHWGRGPMEAAPTETTADITRWAVAHGRERVVLTVRLRRVVPDSIGLSWFLRTSERPRTYAVQLTRWGGDRGFRLVYDWNERGTYRPVSCPGARWSANPRTDRVVISIPRSCLRDPAWVRSGIVAGAPDNDPTDEMSYYDDGIVDGDTTYYDPTIAATRVSVG